MNDDFINDLGIKICEALDISRKFERVAILDSNKNISIYYDDDKKEHRPHAHISLNNNRIGWIWLDT